MIQKKNQVIVLNNIYVDEKENDSSLHDYSQNGPDSEAKPTNELSKDEDEDSFDRDTEELKIDENLLPSKTKSYTPINKGKFVRKKELEGTLGKGNTLGGLNSAEIQVLKFLGSGGEGKVYLGCITELDQLVAFKQFEIIENEEQEQRIMEAIK